MRFETSKGFFEFDENLRVPFKREQLINTYWLFHPRYRFVKSTQSGTFLDLGSGSGGLQFWKSWGLPERKDLKMYAIDIQKGEFCDRYEDFKEFDLNKSDFPYEDAFFDSIFSAHVLEHIEKPMVLVKNIDKALKVGGYLYIEQPNHNSINVPPMLELQNNGIKCARTTTNFHDDCTHLRPYDHSEVVDMFFSEELQGKYKVMEQGTIANDFLAKYLMAYGYQKDDQETFTYGIWLKYLWSDWILLKKVS